MRLVSQRQRSLSFYQSLPSFTQEWETISSVLEANRWVYQQVWEDLTRKAKRGAKKPTGARGMTAEQVVRFAVVKMKEQLSYRDLESHVADSICLREFCLVGYEQAPSFTTLQENIKRIAPETWHTINAAIVDYAFAQGVEDGRRMRMDTTGVQSNIHHPTDSHQLWDCVRVLARILQRVETDVARLRGAFHDHRRACKRLFARIHNTHGQDAKKPLYKRLIALTEKTVAYARQALKDLAAEHCSGMEEMLMAAAFTADLEHFVPLAQRVIEQSRRRVLLGENVPAEEKILSIFEPHTDIIKKGRREILYGHKVLFTGGQSNLILDCKTMRGNPADSAQFMPALEQHEKQFGSVPNQVATDAGFASRANARDASRKGVRDTAFAAPRQKDLVQTRPDSKTFKRLRNWRSGIEGIISAVKRAFGLRRCTWSGYASFQAYVHLAVLTFNLQTLARHLIT